MTVKVSEEEGLAVKTFPCAEMLCIYAIAGSFDWHKVMPHTSVRGISSVVTSLAQTVTGRGSTPLQEFFFLNGPEGAGSKDWLA